jgi:hypothetical protein
MIMFMSVGLLSSGEADRYPTCRPFHRYPMTGAWLLALLGASLIGSVSRERMDDLGTSEGIQSSRLLLRRRNGSVS